MEEMVKSPWPSLLAAQFPLHLARLFEGTPMPSGRKALSIESLGVSEAMKCPSCGAEASGKFCSSCGGPLKVEKCSSCGASAPPGSKFCTGCGKPMRAGGRKSVSGSSAQRPGRQEPVPAGNANMAWWVAGGMLVVTLVALGYPMEQKPRPERFHPEKVRHNNWNTPFYPS